MTDQNSSPRRTVPLHVKITLLSFALIVFIIIAGGAILIENFTYTLEDELGERAMAIARTVAQIEDIQEHVGLSGGDRVIQPIAEKIRLATNVEYIVVIDMERTRYSHPLQERIGGKLVGGDEAAALANHHYISRATGVLGPSVRAFAPIKTEEGTRQVGVVVVGILTPTLASLLQEIRTELYLSLAAGLFLGMLGSIFLSQNIKKTLFNMEPQEIARLLEEREAVFHTVDIGITAIDRDGKLTLVNNESRRILNVDEEPTGKNIVDVVPNTSLPEVAKTGVPEYNKDFMLRGTKILVNRIPIRVGGNIMGAVATFKDKTEMHKLAEELTGVKNFIEALRVQNHEYMNKLHTIAGLIQLDKKEEATAYIFAVTEEQQELTTFLTKNIRDYKLAGLLLGKHSHAEELKIELLIDEESHLTRLPPDMDSVSLVIILGNLLQNAMEALTSLPQERRKIFLKIQQTPPSLNIRVEDLGMGIKKEHMSEVCKKGFTTKGETNQGLGLHLVEQHIKSAGGSIHMESEAGKGTIFSIEIPY